MAIEVMKPQKRLAAVVITFVLLSFTPPGEPGHDNFFDGYFKIGRNAPSQFSPGGLAS